MTYHCTYCDIVFQHDKGHECNSNAGENSLHGISRQRDEDLTKRGVIDFNGNPIYPSQDI